MLDWHNIWSFDTARFRVTLDWSWEDCPDLSWDETGEVRAKIESGEWGNYTFRVRVTLDGREVACDYLGNCIYADPAEFRDHIGLAAKARADGSHVAAAWALAASLNWTGQWAGGALDNKGARVWVSVDRPSSERFDVK